MILRNGYDAPSIRSDCHLINGICMTFEGMYEFAGFQVRALKVTSIFQGVVASVADCRCANRRATDT
jgi:hypothetical protein